MVTATSLFAQGYPGRRPVTCQEGNISLQDLFKLIYEQTGMTAFYNDEQLSSYETVSPDFHQEPLDNVLAWLLRKRGMVWCYRKEVFVVAFKKPGDEDLGLLPEEKRRTITGIVVNEKILPMEGVAVMVKGGPNGAYTNKEGRFLLEDVEQNIGLLVRTNGYKPMELYSYADSVYVQLIPMSSPLQEVNVKGAAQRTLTGSVSEIDAGQVASQPVNNVLGALQGRVPGLYISQTTGLPGGGYRIRLRGRNSIESVSDPLILVDGIPFPSVSFNENYVNDIGNGAPLSSSVAASPLNLLTVNNIESIDILKDADATAIYGTRGANGVILINSKMPGREKGMTANYYTGIGQAVNLVRYMDTKQYVAMRQEAIRNDSGNVDDPIHYDLNSWGTERYTDWQKEMIGNTARISEGSLEMTGGDETFAFRWSGVYRKESTVYPVDSFRYTKGGTMMQLMFNSPDRRLRVTLSGNYVSDHNLLPTTDLTTYATLPPNTPEAYTDINERKLNFEYRDFENPFAVLLRTAQARSSNWRGNLTASYEPVDGLIFRANMGTSKFYVSEVRVNPVRSFSPATGITSGESYFFNNLYRNTLLDYQIGWKRTIGKEQFDLQAGARLQFDDQHLKSLYAFDYKSDDGLRDTSAAGGVMTLDSVDANYQYRSFYGRLEFKHDNKYILALTVNRDHSDRLSIGNRNATFGSIGAAWVFSREGLLKKSRVLSLGKLRGSYGWTGNDQYVRNMDRETAVPDSVLPRRGNRPRNDDYTPVHTWERIRKAELALDLGFLQDRILATLCYYNNKSTNQLLTGHFKTSSGEEHFLPINYDAVVENKGFELDLEVTPFRGGRFNWTTDLNLSFASNELVAFPNLAQMKYQEYYNVGMSLDMVQGYHLQKVDPTSGIYRFDDPHSDGLLMDDYKYGQEQGPFVYGGWYNNVRRGNFELNFLLRFAKQNNYNYQYLASPYVPGTIGNQLLLVQDRWQQPGDQVHIQRYTTSLASPAGSLFGFARKSDRQLTDASYIRLQSLVVAYYISAKKLNKINIKSCKLYIQGLNLFTISKYNGRDPEILAGPERYPSLRVITAGIRISY